MSDPKQVCKDRYKNLKNKTYFRRLARDSYWWLNESILFFQEPGAAPVVHAVGFHELQTCLCGDS